MRCHTSLGDWGFLVGPQATADEIADSGRLRHPAHRRGTTVHESTPPAHADLPAPRPATPPPPGRGPVLDIRRASGLPLRVRAERQADRDALVHRLQRSTADCVELSEERLDLVDELAAVRDELYPPIPWCHGRRPPDLDRGPLPAAPEGFRGAHRPVRCEPPAWRSCADMDRSRCLSCTACSTATAT